MPGPAPKPAHLRQRMNRKAGSTTLSTGVSVRVPPIPNPDKRTWHPLTRKAWRHAWTSPMASQWLQTDADAIARLAVLWDNFHKSPSADALKEIRLQGALFGLSPLDRCRLQWEISPADPAQASTRPTRTGTDPRATLMAVK
jgi:hypothetical protein